MSLEEEKKKEHQRQNRWDLLGLITWLLTFGWIRWIFTDIPFRGRRYPRKPPITSDEPPLVSLANLAEKGLTKAEPAGMKEKETIEEVLALFFAVALKDGNISESEIKLVEDFISEISLKTATTDEINSFMEYFKSLSSQDINIKNLCFSLKRGLSQPQAKLVFENLYHLAYLHGLEIEERREVERIAGRLGMSAPDIRFALMNAKKKTETSGN